MRNLIFISLLISTSVCAQTITRLEYYFDTDPGFGNGISIPISSAADLARDFSVPLNTVNEGFHLLYIRAKGNNGLWSLPQSRPVLVQRSAQSASIYSINRIEYFFDTDPGFGNGSAIPISSAIDLTKDFQLPISTIAEGIHTIYYRAKSNNGLWSTLLARPVFVQSNAQTSSTPSLKRIEYFFDADPGIGNGIQISTSGSTSDQSLVINLATINSGFHILYVRSEDIQGRWSQPVPKPFFVGKSGSNIVALEYYYVDGTGKSIIKIYNGFTPGKDITVDFAAVLDGLLPNTFYEIHVTAINSDGTRSAEAVHTFTTPAIICDPISVPSTVAASRCGSGAVTLTASGAIGTQTYRWYQTATGGTALAGEITNVFTIPSLATTTTFFVSIVNGTCESARTAVTATVLACNEPPVIIPATLTTASETVATLDLLPLLSDPDNNLDLSTLRIVSQPSSGAHAEIVNTILSVDYVGVYFSGKEALEIEICDLVGSCTTETFTINVEGKLVVYNGISPNGDFKNDVLRIKFIEQIPDTKKNKVMIFNRWGNLVFEMTNYDNHDRVFRGLNKNGSELPSGVYFYKIEFAGAKEPISGYLTIKR
ncbi:MAG: gliding motility-associated C-terminal domain-containing protein [Cyclobacteriaceae bacterium]|nr:gliding motility-associated C-terminal domain-containing protein [Cyclobacteriaceae bacterium]